MRNLQMQLYFKMRPTFHSCSGKEKKKEENLLTEYGVFGKRFSNREMLKSQGYRFKMLTENIWKSTRFENLTSCGTRRLFSWLLLRFQISLG